MNNNQRTVLIHLIRETEKQAFKTKTILERITSKAPLAIHNLEVGLGVGGGWVCGFALYDPTDGEVSDMHGWLLDHGFGIPKIYVI